LAITVLSLIARPVDQGRDVIGVCFRSGAASDSSTPGFGFRWAAPARFMTNELLFPMKNTWP